MTVQDDDRERELRTLFNMVRPEEFGRADVDAILELDTPSGDLQVPFELKSATRSRPSISTVRDMGPAHLEKWRSLHWLFGVYDSGSRPRLQYCLYGSPKAMRPWIDEMSAYIAADVALAKNVPALLGDAALTDSLGDREAFDAADARRLMKRQYTAAQYLAASDLPGGMYSRQAMLSLLRERCAYLIRRGATLNNPHIRPGYFQGWERIERNHAARLRTMVAAAIAEEAGDG